MEDGVKITRAGDSSFKMGQVVPIEEFMDMVRKVLVNGGEIPDGHVVEM